NKTRFKIRMSEDVEELQEVVVVAYGEAKAEDIVGSVDQVTAKELEGVQVNSFEQMLAGQAAGVQIRSGTGRPDGGGEILLRGVGTGGDNAPLLVIDGVAFGNYNSTTNNFLALVDPDDIESVSVVRDASGAALYGSRAGNGLIIVTTKGGRKGKPRITFDANTAVQTIPDFERPNILTAAELAQFQQERFLDNGGDPDEIPEEFQNPKRYGRGTDWFDLITQDAIRSKASLSIRGGTDAVTYNVSAGYTDNDGIVKETNFKRYTFRANFNAEVTPWLKIGTIIAPSQTVSNVAGIDPGTGQFQAFHVMQVARWADPSAPAYDENGNLTTTTRGDLLP
ncbi:MAG: TonB-dependent receptor plug domain-containing protein, partial [Bacteroidota bacterium]